MTKTTTLTAMETEMLLAILNSEYHSTDRAHRANEAVWTFSVTDAVKSPCSAHGGVCASLSKKGLAVFQDLRDDDGVCWLTEEGLRAALAAR